MALSYATFVTRLLGYLQDTGAATYDSTQTGYAIENELKRLSRYGPTILDVIYRVESREGSDTAGTTDKLTDTGKSQFLSTDPTNEKVVHNITDDTWAVITGYTSTSVVTISNDIMASGESYEIYNKQCRNKRQIYIGDMAPYLWIESVEYPIGVERTFFHVSKDIIELEVEDFVVKDSDSTISTLNKVDVLVKFAVPQVLCQLADLAGAVHTEGAAAATTMQVKNFTDAQIVEVGEMFNIAGHRTTYIVTTQLTLADQASTGSSLAFHPPLEAVASVGDVITFVQSTLQPNHEDILELLVASTLKISDAEQLRIQAMADLVTGRALLNTVNVGGPGVPEEYIQYAQAGLTTARAIAASAREVQTRLIRTRLETLANPRPAKILPRGTVAV